MIESSALSPLLFVLCCTCHVSTSVYPDISTLIVSRFEPELAKSVKRASLSISSWTDLRCTDGPQEQHCACWTLRCLELMCVYVHECVCVASVLACSMPAAHGVYYKSTRCLFSLLIPVPQLSRAPSKLPQTTAPWATWHSVNRYSVSQEKKIIHFAILGYICSFFFLFCTMVSSLWLNSLQDLIALAC